MTRFRPPAAKYWPQHIIYDKLVYGIGRLTSFAIASYLHNIYYDYIYAIRLLSRDAMRGAHGECVYFQ